jgi:hypothetical protein
MKASLAFVSVAVVGLLGGLTSNALIGGARATATTAAAVVSAQDFEVTIASGIPAPAPGAGLPACVGPDPGGVRTCVVSGTVSTGAGSKFLTGTVRQTSTGRSGTMEAICRWSGDYRATTRVSLSPTMSPIVELTELSGSVSQSCSWSIFIRHEDTGKVSGITGSMSGDGSLALAGPATGAYTGTLKVFAGVGTGEFAGLVGDGSFTHRQDFAVPLSAPPGFSPFELTAATSEPSSLQLSLRKGKPLALVAAPGARLNAKTDIGLRVVSALGSSCAATARKGTRSVRLGPARDGNRDGLVVVVPRLRPKLTSGRWTLAVKCTYRVGATAGTALKRVVVTVT